jgi:hypothetical protein
MVPDLRDTPVLTIMFPHRIALKGSQYTYVFLDSPKDV